MTSSLQGQRCLVTGAAGYLGRHLVDALVARGCEVHALDVLDEPSPREGVRWFRGDVRDPSDLARACEGVDVVFHTAAIIDLSEIAPRRVRERVRGVNVGGTRALLEAAREAGCTRFVHTSSTNAVYRQATAGGDESLPYTTSEDLYSSTKAESERLVLEANGQGGLSTCAIRPGGIYGPGERNTIVGPLCESIAKGAPVVTLGGGHNRIDYTFIDNLVDAQLRAAERLGPGSPVAGQAYFVSDGQPINPGEFSAALVDRMELGARRVRMPRPVAHALGWAMEVTSLVTGRPALLTRALVGTACTDAYFSLDKARRDLGYEPLVSTDEGLARTAPDAREFYASLTEG